MQNYTSRVDLTYLESMGFDNEIINELIGEFFKQVDEFLLLEKYFSEKNWWDLKEVAHKAISSVSVFGLQQFSGMLRSIQLVGEGFLLAEYIEKENRGLLSNEDKYKKSKLHFVDNLSEEELIKWNFTIEDITNIKNEIDLFSNHEDLFLLPILVSESIVMFNELHLELIDLRNKFENS